MDYKVLEMTGSIKLGVFTTRNGVVECFEVAEPTTTGERIQRTRCETTARGYYRDTIARIDRADGYIA